jgi:hypothetical protein
MAKVYCCCYKADQLVCSKCEKGDKIGAFEKVAVPTWPQYKPITQPVIVQRRNK